MIKTDDKWLVPRKRLIPCLWPLITYWNWDVAGFVGLKSVGRVFNVWEKGDYSAIMEVEAVDKIGEILFNRLYTDLDSLEDIRQKGIVVGKEVVTFCKNFAEKTDNAEIADYIEFFDGLSKEYPKIMKENMFYWFSTAPIIEKKIRASFSEEKESKVNEIIQIMSLSKIPSYSEIEEKDFRDLILIARKERLDSKKVDDLIKEFSDKYFWFPYEYAGPRIWNEKEVRKRLESEMKNDFAIEEKDIDKMQEVCIKENNISKEVINLFKLLQYVGLLQDDRKMFNSQVCYYVNGVILGKLAEKLNISLVEARYVNQDLLRLYLRDEEGFRSEIEKRSEFSVLEQVDGENNYYNFENGRKHLKNLGIDISSDVGSVDEIKGQIANKGVVKGTVRVLKTSHIDDFEEGSVIVTGMTTPDFVPLMKKASAIITDEGGITSHAAIVSREIGIPCVIGTKIATNVLKDGDLVEVNANKGVIKRL